MAAVVVVGAAVAVGAAVVEAVVVVEVAAATVVGEAAAAEVTMGVIVWVVIGREGDPAGTIAPDQPPLPIVG